VIVVLALEPSFDTVVSVAISPLAGFTANIIMAKKMTAQRCTNPQVIVLRWNAPD
jgi:hypothetical protein